MPLLNVLQDIHQKRYGDVVGRVAEGLQRVALGLSKNPSLQTKEVLLYLHSTLQPFVAAIAKDFMIQREALGKLSIAGTKRKVDQVVTGNAVTMTTITDDYDDFDALDSALPSYLREDSSDDEDKALYAPKSTRDDDVSGYKARTWLPSERRSLLEQRAVIEARNKEARLRIQVLDGASAPKLTGYNRVIQSRSNSSKLFNALQGTGGDRATLIAIKFCLTFLYSCLRRNKFEYNDKDVQSMALPFLPLLGKCIQLSTASHIVGLAVKCLITFISWGIPVESSFLTALGNRLLKLIFRGGGLVSTETELAQACTKGLSSLFKIYNAKMVDYNAKKQHLKRKSFEKNNPSTTTTITIDEDDSSGDIMKPVLPLALDNMRALVQMLTVSIMEVTSAFQTAAFQLVREIIVTRILIPEIYDLITKLAEQIVLSQRKGVRDAATSIVVTFIISYPLSEKRVASQLRQLINNCSFEFEEGRCSALNALVLLIKALPLPVLEDYSQMIFLPTTLRIVNDKAAICREKAAAVIISLIRKINTDSVLQFIDFVQLWLNSGRASATTTLTTTTIISSNSSRESMTPQNKMLIRTGSQVANLIVQARPDICKRDGHVSSFIQSVHHYLSILLIPSSSSSSSSTTSSSSLLVNKTRMRNSLDKLEMAKFDEGMGAMGRADDDWVIIYHLLCLCEQLYIHLPSATDYAVTHVTLRETCSSTDVDILPDWCRTIPLMELIQESLLFPHAWVRSASCRVLSYYLRRRDTVVDHHHHHPRLITSLKDGGIEVLTMPNSLYHMARRICIVLNQFNLSSKLLDSLVECIVFVIRAMTHNPHLNVVPVEDLMVKHRSSSSSTTSMRKRKIDRGMLSDVDHDDDDDDDGGGDDDDFIASAYANNVDNEGDEEEAHSSWSRAMEIADAATLDITAADGDDDDDDDKVVDDHDDDDGVHDDDDDDGQRMGSATLPTQNSTLLVQRPSIDIIHHTNSSGDNGINSSSDDIDGDEVSSSGGAHWVMHRLRGIGSDSRGNRRLHVIKVFLHLVRIESVEFIILYMEQIIDIAIRALLTVNTTPDDTKCMIEMTKEHATNLLQLLEASVGSSVFIGHYSLIQRRIENSKNEKRRKLAAEAIIEPKIYAERKIIQTTKKREGKKRQTMKFTAIKGLKRRASRSTESY